MVDLETLGVGSDAAILSIGLARFALRGKVGETLLLNIDVASCVAAGMTLTDSTVRWWMGQDDLARDHIHNPHPEPLGLRRALAEVGGFIQPGDILWGNGASFDNAILQSAYDKVHMAQPWAFYNNRCYRTLKNLFPDVPRVAPKIPHHPVEDAVAQAQHTINIFAAHPELNG